MKIGGLLLALLVILLSGIPCCTFEECEEELAEKHSSQEIPGDCEDSCSPFINCNGCTGFIFQENPENKNTIFLSPLVIIISHPRGLIPGGIIPQVWQPPQVS